MRLIIISNRAPVNIIKDDNKISYSDSSGGLASGLRTYIEKEKIKNPSQEILWIGWPGTSVDDESTVRKEILERYGTYSVFLRDELMEKFYEGFCNKTIWPLFHYFPYFTSYESSDWETYVRVNEIYCDALIKNYQKGDVIWVHDYHLMLLPALIREKVPDASIGFFLHI